MQCARTPRVIDFEKLDSSSPECNTEMYRSLVGSLLYLSQWSRLDITAAVNLLVRHVSNPRENHWQAVKRVLRYLMETASKHLYIVPEGQMKLMAYMDASSGNDVTTCQSTYGMTI